MIELADKWTRQPQGVRRIDRSHPLARGLTAAFEAQAGKFVDVLNTPQSATVDTQSLRPSAAGTALVGDGTNYVRYANNNARYGSVPPFTLAAYLVRRGTLTQYRRVVENGALRSPNTSGWDIDADAANGLVFIGWPATNISTTTGPLPLDTPTLLVWSVNAGGITTYVDGVQSSSNAAANYFSATDGAFSLLRILSDEHSPTANIDIVSARIWASRALSAADVKALYSNYWQIYAKRPKRLFAAPAVTKAVGLAAETDTAFALSAALAGATGLAAETDTALTLSGLQARAVGLATEVDAALPLAAAQSQLVGLATETDTAFALSAGASTPVGLAAETDTAFALNAVQLKAVGLSTESDTAFALSAARPAGLTTEADTALTLTGLQIRGVGLASEASTALALAGLQLRATGLATETDIALARAPVQIRSAGLSTEVDTALALAPNVPGAVGLAVETDIALALAGRQIRAVGMATETDAALALTPIQRMAPGLALEIDASFALSAVQLRAVGLATETDTALALDPASTGGTADPADVWNYVLSNGLTAEETAVQTHAMLTALLASCPADLALVLKLLRNKQVTNPSTGRMTVYDDDGSTVLLEGNLFEDAAGAQPYRGQGAERRERLT